MSESSNFKNNEKNGSLRKKKRVNPFQICLLSREALINDHFLKSLNSKSPLPFFDKWIVNYISFFLTIRELEEGYKDEILHSSPAIEHLRIRRTHKTLSFKIFQFSL